MYNLKNKDLLKALWIGIPKYTCNNEEEKQELIELYEKHNCIPIFLEKELEDDYFHYYENIMKPLFYNFKGLYDGGKTISKVDDWRSFKTVNERFAEKIIETKDKYEQEQSNVFIWLNNHQLFLVPQYLRRKIRDSNIGLYMHSPFPSSDIFRIFPYRNAILKSILECDCIGFHVYEHARHFMVCCKRVLGIDNEIAKNGHFIIKYKPESPVMIRIGHA